MKILIVKSAIAATAITSVVVLAASGLLPGVAPWRVVLGIAALAAGLFAAAALYVYIAGSMNQLLLRWGAIDTEWFWFPDDPKGFKAVWRNGAKNVERSAPPPP